jgi:hypothetical protein
MKRLLAVSVGFSPDRDADAFATHGSRGWLIRLFASMTPKISWNRGFLVSSTEYTQRSADLQGLVKADGQVSCFASTHAQRFRSSDARNSP